MEYQKDDKIICINREDYNYLTEGKEYTIVTIIPWYHKKYIIIDDFYYRRSINIKNFKSTRLVKLDKIRNGIQ